jgi:hypothetical protein
MPSEVFPQWLTQWKIKNEWEYLSNAN